MVVPATAEGFRGVVSALPALDGREGVTFHTFTLPVDPCMRLLMKNLGTGLPESVVREDLESEYSCPGIHTAAIRPPRSGHSQRPTSHTHFIVSVARGPEFSRVRSLTELCGLRVSVESYLTPKGSLQCKRCQRFRHTQQN
jgi:hypothetical protein